jgi:DNA-binding XRE family transcriptional regulator
MAAAKSEKPPETHPYYVGVGLAFAHLRADRGQTVDQLVALGSLDKRSIEKIEEGRIDIQLRNHRILADLLKTTLDDVHDLARQLDPRRADAVAERSTGINRSLVVTARAIAEQLVRVLSAILHDPPVARSESREGEDRR